MSKSKKVGTIFSKYNLVMIKKILLFAIVSFIGLNSFSQKGQRIAFVDMNYILENIPAYTRAQTQLDKKVQIWQQDLDQKRGEITTMQTDLSNEKTLLTEDLIADKEEDIVIKQLELKKTEASYFSTNGNLFLLRKQLVTPIQDQVYNAAQEIAKARRYDYVFDKSSDLIMLYSNKSNDISELVLRTIVRGEKATNATKKRAAVNNKSPKTIDGESDPILDEREAKRSAALTRIEEQKLARAKKREEQKVAIEKKRLERLKQREDVRGELKTNKEEPSETKKTEDKKEDSKDEKEDEQKENNN